MLSCGRGCKLGGTAEVGGFDAVETIDDTAKVATSQHEKGSHKKDSQICIFLLKVSGQGNLSNGIFKHKKTKCKMRLSTAVFERSGTFM